VRIEGGIACFAPRANHWERRMPLLPCKTVVLIGAVVDVALHSSEGAVCASDVADRLQLPQRHLEPVLQALVREGILVGMRGPRGGYKLAKSRQAISVYDISEAAKTVEPEKPSKKFSGLLGAVVMPTLAQAEQCFASALERITVEDLVQAASLQMLAGYKTDVMAG
jgi:Rrf2 family transcriptional regulator, iron-sulfur cluster assembly transcription factor